MERGVTKMTKIESGNKTLEPDEEYWQRGIKEHQQANEDARKCRLDIDIKTACAFTRSLTVGLSCS